MRGNFKYMLDKSSKKHPCPMCGKKSAVAYIDIETDQYLDLKYSRCDREQKCGYHLKPEHETPSKEFVSPPPKPITYLPLKLIQNSGRNYKQNNFIQYLKTQFEDEAIQEMIKRYLIGTSSYIENGCIFWQVDEQNRVRSGKMMKYNPKTGKRVKDEHSYNWVMKIMQQRGALKEYNREQCFFGLHLVNEYKTKPIAICESEKTACVMSMIFDNYLWLASSSASHMQQHKFKPLKGRKIILYPDLGQFDNWKAIAERQKTFGYDVEVSEILEQNATENEKKGGLDIADYFLNQQELEHYARARTSDYNNKRTTTRTRARQKPKIERFIEINPSIINLINTFGLEHANGTEILRAV